MAEAVDSTEVQQPAAAGDEDDRKPGSGLDPDVSIGFVDPDSAKQNKNQKEVKK
jgi:hypothetical protein